LNLIILTEDSQENRWLYGMKSIDAFLESCGFNLEQKRELLESLKTGFRNEFGIDKEIRKQLSKKYRDNRSKIEAVFNDKNEGLDNLIKVFIEESKVYFAIVFQKRKSNSTDKSRTIDTLLSSYIHMHCNRLFSLNNAKVNRFYTIYCTSIITEK
jgi:thiopeptide-type bacteriocin biosynthesis protein